MLNLFKANIAKYPRLFKVWLALAVLAVAESYIPRLVGIDALHTQYALAVDFVLALVLALVIYRYVTSGPRTGILLSILDRFEGRDVCTVAEHNVTDEEETSDEDYYEEEPEEEEEEPEEGDYVG